MSEKEIWNELCLCILASNVQYELAKSSLKYLIESNLLNIHWILNNVNAKVILSNELKKPIFLPKKKDGNLRKYRFPTIRSKNIVDAAFILYSREKTIIYLIKQFKKGHELRNNLAQNVPGLGFKESSHFLRNIGYSCDLAIIDVHIISFLKILKLLPQKKFVVTPKLYLDIETFMVYISQEYCLNLSILDNAIWHYMRSRKV